MNELESTAEEMGAHSEPVAERLHELVPAGAATLAVTPQVQASDLVARLSVIREAMDSAMQEGVDYGNVPGTDKPTLFKPGSEKLGVLFQLDIQLVNEKVWGPGGHLTVMSHATVFHAPLRIRLGYGEGLCTTRERKYAKRKQERTCPTCGKPAVIKGKDEFGGGWLCWKKRDGCGAKFQDGDQAIEAQDVGDIDNPDLPDLWNTVVKMAEKRARVDAVLAVTGASALFTQDMEDQADSPVAEPPQSRAPGRPNRPSDGQLKYLKSLVQKSKATPAQLRMMLDAVGADAVEVKAGWLDHLTGGRDGTASALIERFKQGALPDPEHPSDVDSSGFEQPPLDESGTPWEGS